MITTWISQKIANAIQMPPGTPAQPLHAAVSSVCSASAADPGLDAEPAAGDDARAASPARWRRVTPKLARHSTGNDTPYFVPACAFSTIGTSTMTLPSRIVTIACHQVMPCCIRPEASV